MPENEDANIPSERKRGPLTDKTVKSLKKEKNKPCKRFDGGGLYVLATDDALYWRLDYRFTGKRKTLAIGVYPHVSLADARAARDAAKKLLAAGVDPMQAKHEEKRNKRLSAENTFEVLARDWHENVKGGWTTNYADNVLTRLEADIFPEIGSPAVADIEPPELLDALRKVEPLYFYIDASDLSGTSSTHHLDEIAAGAKAKGVALIPATRITAGGSYQSAVKRMVANDGRGVALRVTLDEMTSASTWGPSLSYPLNNTDLIVDLAGSVANVTQLGVSALNAFSSLYNGAGWRSVTVAGGCVPAALTNFKVGVTEWTRNELRLWHKLQSHGLPYPIDFGDYASISPDASVDAIPGPVPINGKYSLAEKFLIFHGVKIKGPGSKPQDTQLRSYATSIVSHPNRGALVHCWGDARFDEIAVNTGVSASSPGGWVGFNVNRHIEITRHLLP